MTHRIRSPLNPAELSWQLALAVMYALTSWLFQFLFMPSGKAVLFFLPSGIALAAVLIGGRRYFFAVFAGALLAYVLMGYALWLGAMMAFGSAIGAVANAWLVRRWGNFDVRLRSLRDLLQLGFGAFVGSTGSAAVGVSSLWMAGLVGSNDVGATLLQWWQGDVLGIVLVTPLILVWRPTPSAPIQRFSMRELFEATLVLGLLLLAGGLVFLDWGHQWGPPSMQRWLDTVGAPYWMFFYISWIAVRLGARVTSLALLLVATLGIAGAYHDLGYFGKGQRDYQLYSYWFYTLILCLVGMALAILIAQGQRTRHGLRKLNADTSNELDNFLAALDGHALLSVSDLQGRMTLVNNKLCEFSGYSRAELLGQDHRLLNSNLHPQAFFREMYETIHAGQVWQSEMRDRKKDGAFYWMDTTITPFLGQDGKPEKFITIRTDITVRKAAEHELQHHRQQLEKLVQARTADLQQSIELNNWAMAELKQQKFILDQHASVLITDVAGRITYANEKLCALTGYSYGELMGQNPYLFHSGKHPKGFFKDMFETINRGEVWHDEVCSRAKDGHLVWVDMTVVAFMGTDGKAHSYMAVRTDISKRKYAETAAQAASTAKSDFLANMSHEIRTPMNGVIGMVDVLQETKLTLEQHRIVGIIQQSSLSLLAILNDILDISKIEAGRLAIEHLPIPIRLVCEEIVQFMGMGSKTAAVELSLFVAPELPHSMLTDTTRLRQVLINLLGNAIKFSMAKPGQTSHVRLSVAPCNLNGDFPGIRFTVADNGIGISPQTLGTLFQPFTQADESTARKFGGTGLGLSITHRLLALMGGHISVRSTLGEGSEFVAELPLQEVRPEQSDVLDPRIDGVQVLAVTADAFTAQVIRSYCSHAGTQVQVVADLATAKAQLPALKSQPNGAVPVLLLDLESSAELPAGLGVVWLTRTVEQAQGEGLRLSVLPLLYAQLMRCVASAGSSASVSMLLPSPVQMQGAPRSEVPSVEEAQRSGRLILLAEDNETNREVIQEQLRLLGHASEAAEDGLVALEMWRTGRFALLLTDCHMPNMDGFGLTAAIRQAEGKGQHLPIVAVTASTMQGQVERCLQQGMDDFLAKPLRLVELDNMVRKWLPAPPQPLESIQQLEPPETVAIPASMMAIWDASVLSEMTGENPPLHRRLLEKFLLNSETQVQTLMVSTDAGEFAAVADLAHALKSASRMVGALHLGELCEQLETAGSDSDGPACHRLKAGLAQAFDQSRVSVMEHLEGLAL